MNSFRQVGSRVLVLLGLSIAWASGSQASDRVALIIGNASYRPGFELKNPIKDAQGLADKLMSLGFHVTLALDSDLATVQRALDRFTASANQPEAALVFYAGHGVTIAGRNFMLPVDFQLGSFDDVDADALDTDRMLQALSATHAKVKLLWFDACRNNPLQSRGAIPITEPADTEARTENTLIAFSTAQGHTAADGKGNNSPFAEGLLTNLGQDDVELRDLMRKVRIYVRDATGSTQTMWVEDSMTVDFHFTSRSKGALAGLIVPEPLPQVAGLVFADSSERLLTDTELRSLDAATLRLARNEIFARNGRYFREDALTQHFAAFGWYRPNTWDPQLSVLERKNIALIRRYELSGSAVTGGFLFADSDRRLLKSDEVADLSKSELRIARNEIYARRGRKFKDKNLARHFEKFAWYRPQLGEIELTFIELQNVKLIQRYESAQ